LTIGFCLIRSQKTASGNPEKKQARSQFPRFCRLLKDLVIQSTGMWISMLIRLLMTAINAAMTVFLAYCPKNRRRELQFAGQAARHETRHPCSRNVHIMTARHLAEAAFYRAAQTRRGWKTENSRQKSRSSRRAPERRVAVIFSRSRTRHTHRRIR